MDQPAIVVSHKSLYFDYHFEPFVCHSEAKPKNLVVPISKPGRKKHGNAVISTNGSNLKKAVTY